MVDYEFIGAIIIVLLLFFEFSQGSLSRWWVGLGNNQPVSSSGILPTMSAVKEDSVLSDWDRIQMSGELEDYKKRTSTDAYLIAAHQFDKYVEQATKLMPKPVKPGG